MTEVSTAIPPRTLSIVIPVYNERRYLREILERVEAAPMPAMLQRQIVLVDDGSTDGTRDLMRELSQTRDDLKIILQERNRGKGAALRAGFAAADGDVVLVQDADFEYDPHDYMALLEPIVEGHADVVFGSRFVDAREHRGWHRMGNRVLTMLSNLTTGLRLTDMECGYKVFRREILRQITIEENRFGFEPEIAAKVARLHVRLAEVPVSYAGRTYEEGKKINWKDGISAIRCILKYGLFGGRTQGNSSGGGRGGGRRPQPPL
jgi:glycosyltransferase involved in cell wall biosynthesis